MIAIKGMEMPSDCMECMFCNHIKNDDYGSHYGDCAILGDGERMNLLLHQKHSYCPLVEIVTCKECKFNCNNTCIMEGCGITVEEDYFCAGGERKVNE